MFKVLQNTDTQMRIRVWSLGFRASLGVGMSRVLKG